MTGKQVMARLKALGSAQTRKTYARHGVTGDMFGVKYGELKPLVRQIGTDHPLALSLWDSGNHDARIVATMIVDHERVTATLLREWIKAVDNHVLSSALANVVAGSEAGRKIMRRWLTARGEWPAATGWMAVGNVAGEVGAISVKEGRELLAIVEDRIHGSKNRVKYSMNTAMIALGAYVPGLEDHAVKVADRIGQVEVDHGATDCKTPLASPYIRKAAAHHRAKLAKRSAPRKKTSARARAPRRARA
jgi:3-methyladenine DNA glycosylase AlkD